MSMEPFDHTELYEREIEPHLQAIQDICLAHGMPMLVGVNIARSTPPENAGPGDSNSTVATRIVSDADKLLPDTMIAAHAFLSEGFEAGVHKVQELIYLKRKGPGGSTLRHEPH